MIAVGHSIHDSERDREGERCKGSANLLVVANEFVSLQAIGLQTLVPL